MKRILIIAALVGTTAWSQVPVHVSADHVVHRSRPLVPKGKLLRGNPHRFTAIRLQGTDPYDAPDDDYICGGSARRPKIEPLQVNDSDDELSDHVTMRLAVARARAMARYRELHA